MSQVTSSLRVSEEVVFEVELEDACVSVSWRVHVLEHACRLGDACRTHGCTMHALAEMHED